MTSSRAHVEAAVELLEKALELDDMGADAHDDLEQARDYAAGSLPVWEHDTDHETVTDPEQ